MGDDDTKHHILARGADIKWSPPPPVFPAGAKFAVIPGDAAARGTMTRRGAPA
jgi:hypothetical protein